MTNAALRGKPDAGNPHVRFDEGEVASAEKPRRGSLLYKKAFVAGNKCFALVVWLAIAGLAQHSAFAAYDAAGGYVTLLSSNSGVRGESTFMTNIVKETNYGWSDGQDPHSGTNYYCDSSAQLCTPKITNGTFKFPGDSLVIGYRLITLATSTIDVKDLYLEKGGYLMAMNGDKLSLTIQGNLTILGDASKPSFFDIGQSPSHFKVESALKGNSSAYVCSSQAEKFSLYREFVSFDTQYVELDDADEYYGTFEVRTNSCLKLASDLPGTVRVKTGGCLAALASAKIKTLSLEAGATLGFAGGGPIVVTNDFTAAGVITVMVLDGISYPQAVLSVPDGVGTLDASCFVGSGARLSVVSENGVQTLYAEVLEPTAFDETTGYVTQVKGGFFGEGLLRNIFDEPDAWSDGRIPHADTNYYGVGKGIYITTNSIFAGRSLTIERTVFRMLANQPVTIADLRVKGGNGYTSSMFTSLGSYGKYYINGGMTVLSRETDEYPFAFYGSADNLFWISSQKIMGDYSRVFELRGGLNNAPGSIDYYIDLLGDLSEYYGTIIVGTNGTLRLGGSSMPGTIRLDTAYSHVDTIAPDGAEMKIGNLVSRIGTSISVAATNTLAIADALSVTGTLTKNGGGVLASGGTSVAGADAALNVAAGGLRADSAHAFDGIPISFADGATYVRDFAAEDAGLVQYGLYNESAVTAAGTLNVRLVNVPAADAVSGSRVALFTVPESGADALAAAIQFSPRPTGLAVSVTKVSVGGMTTVMAVIERKGFVITFH